jgi:hypothetical protein
MRCYDIKHSWLDKLCLEVKQNIVASAPILNDDTGPISKDFEKQLIDLAILKNYTLTHFDLAMLRIPNSPTSLSCYAWFATYFSLVGDNIPNGSGVGDGDEIHLEPCNVSSIYEEYIRDYPDDHLSLTNVYKLWLACFPHVKIREFKAVTGKCECCANLTNLRKQFKDNKNRSLVTSLHFLHRVTYMGERRGYASRRNLAVMYKDMHCSLISDGMAQGHCELPWLANQNTSSVTLTQHLQGVLNHGRNLTIYRTFHNVPNGANLGIHCFLLSLEKLLAEEGKLPHTVFHQIDGGSENTSKTVIAICELLVSRGLCKRIELTRLLVGHTHEDIDSIFAKIWTYIRSMPILSPQEYLRIIEHALSKRSTPAKVEDILVVPDYVAYMAPYIDKKFGRYLHHTLSVSKSYTAFLSDMRS